jgi:hypothetical protein
MNAAEIGCPLLPAGEIIFTRSAVAVIKLDYDL